jgi:opacity protein-like surface antigen
MNLRNSLASALAAALVFGAVSQASAQADTTRRTTSQTRVRVTKESQGEVVTRRDSAFIRDSIARADSVARMEKMRQDSISRADSMARMERMRLDSIARDSASRADSIARAQQAATPTPPPSNDTIKSPINPSMSSESYGMRHRGGWYLGLGAGPSVPTGTVNDIYKTGFGVTVPIGWQGSGPLGFRIDLGYSRLNGRSPAATGLSFQPDDPSIWSGTANLTLDVIRWGESHRGALYLVGGGGVFRFTDFFSGDRSDNDVTSAFEGKPTTKAGITGGAGLAFPIGGASLFLESRYTNAYTEGESTRWIPITVGFKWR